jgi:hypothetical protein
MSKPIRNAAQTAAVITLAAALLAGCAVTEQRPVTEANVNCAFLGSDCGKLMSGAKGQASLRYVNPAAKWSQYNQVMIEPSHSGTTIRQNIPHDSNRPCWSTSISLWRSTWGRNSRS